MLSNVDAQPTLAVRSLSRARPFYENVLGLRPVGSAMPTVQCYLAGRTVLVIYESEFAGTNKATALTWPLGKALTKNSRGFKGGRRPTRALRHTRHDTGGRCPCRQWPAPCLDHGPRRKHHPFERLRRRLMWGAGRAKPSLLTPPRRRQRRIAGAAKHEMHVRGQLVAKVEDAHPRREFQALGEPFCKAGIPLIDQKSISERRQFST